MPQFVGSKRLAIGGFVSFDNFTGRVLEFHLKQTTAGVCVDDERLSGEVQRSGDHAAHGIIGVETHESVQPPAGKTDRR